MPPADEALPAGDGPLHIVGVAGAGMSALARFLAAGGNRVSGSDLNLPAGTAESLAGEGIETWPGSRPERMAGCRLVAVSSAVPPDDPERRAAERAGIPVWERPRLLAAVTRSTPTVGFGGTHGKTTCTALAATAVRAAGGDPSFIIGGEAADLGGNAHRGAGEPLLLEADEAFRTMTRLRLRGLLVTNVDGDHLEHYGSLAALEEAFADTAAAVDGPVVVGGDDAGGRRLARRTGRPAVGFAPDAEWRISEAEAAEGGVSFRLSGPGTEVAVRVGRPGRHTVRNAAGVLALLALLGWDAERAASGWRRFAGVKRRLEARGEAAGVRIIDTYAHHPTEVAADLQALRGEGRRRLWVVFQPHLYSRTRRLAAEFGRALSAADRVVVTDVYGAREEPEPGVTGRLVAEAVGGGAGRAHYAPTLAEAARLVAGQAEAGDLVVTMGAGDVTELPDLLLAGLEADGG